MSFIFAAERRVHVALLSLSTVTLQADRVSFSFAGGETRLVPGAYIEFAERLVLPQFEHLKASIAHGCCGDRLLLHVSCIICSNLATHPFSLCSLRKWRSSTGATALRLLQPTASLSRPHWRRRRCSDRQLKQQPIEPAAQACAQAGALLSLQRALESVCCAV